MALLSSNLMEQNFTTYRVLSKTHIYCGFSVYSEPKNKRQINDIIE